MLGPISVNSFRTHCTNFLEYDAELWRPLVLLELLEDGLSLAVDELQRRLEDGSHRVAVVHCALPVSSGIWDFWLFHVQGDTSER